jgi:hypothetical protein
LHGFVRNEAGEPLPLVNISIMGTPLGTISNDRGEYSLLSPAGMEITITASILGYEPVSEKITGSAGETLAIDFILKMSFEDISEVYVYHGSMREGTLGRLDIRPLEQMPSIGGKIENLLQTMPGVSGRNEFSSRYSVRGGNFDENLVYVNGIEIYRPVLARSGQHEGMSFINPDMTGSVHFSAGGFNAGYGDKMASVLDITYREPAGFAASASASLLGASVHAEGISGNRKFNYISGGRYSSNQYLFQTLDEQGDFTSSLMDFQTHANFHVSGNLKFSFLGNYSRNIYGFSPVTRETSFGTFDNPLQLMVHFEGRDASKFESFNAALSGYFSPDPDIDCV